LTSFSQRQLGDYSTGSNLCASDIDSMLAQAQEFLQVGREWLANQTKPAEADE